MLIWIHQVVEVPIEIGSAGIISAGKMGSAGIKSAGKMGSAGIISAGISGKSMEKNFSYLGGCTATVV